LPSYVPTFSISKFIEEIKKENTNRRLIYIIFNPIIIPLEIVHLLKKLVSNKLIILLQICTCACYLINYAPLSFTRPLATNSWGLLLQKHSPWIHLQPLHWKQICWQFKSLKQIGSSSYLASAPNCNSATYYYYYYCLD
jgi:hypothetical protein